MTRKTPLPRGVSFPPCPDVPRSSHLTKQPFTAADWDEVQGFDCGDEPHDREVSDWLKGAADQDSALASINHPERPGKVWLYRLDDGRLAGFGAKSPGEAAPSRT